MLLLPYRAVLEINGVDALKFLQGITTNDMQQTSEDKLLYTFFTSAQGKYLADALIQKTNDGVLLEVPQMAANLLLEHFARYKLRHKITCSKSTLQVYVDTENGLIDPRSDNLWRRNYLQTANTDDNFDAYHKRRIASYVVEGGVDMLEYEKGFVLHYTNHLANNGVSFTKGCYLGQEVTTRMHFRQMINKTVTLLHGPQYAYHSPILNAEGVEIGFTLSHNSEDYGLALCNIEHLEPSVTINGVHYQMFSKNVVAS